MEKKNDDTPNAVGVQGTAHVIPTEKWRDGLCDCFTFGCCHAMCCLGCWCLPGKLLFHSYGVSSTQRISFRRDLLVPYRLLYLLPPLSSIPIILSSVLSGQVMTRMGRNFIGAPGDPPAVSKTCMIVTGIWFAAIVIDVILQMVLDSEACWGGRVKYNSEEENVIECPDGTTIEITSTYNTISIIAGIIGLIFSCYMLVAICNTRSAMRRKYNIPPSMCGGCDDFCCACWCSCCAVSVQERLLPPSC
jgi:Cys-rich protein (TIGR01571 family)